MERAVRVVQLMGTVIDLVVFHEDAERLLDHAVELLQEYNRRFSANDDTSELMQVNHQAGIAPVSVHPELFHLIALGKQHSIPSDSFLNIAIGPLVQTWRIGFADATVPTEKIIQQQLLLTNPEEIQLDETNQTVFLTKKGMKIDLGAIAKGYIADQLKAYFVKQSVRSGLINLGGNVLTIGVNEENGEPWKIGLQDPHQSRGRYLGIVPLQGQSMVTSGIYERQLTVNGRHYHHIFDRETGFPVENNLASITIISKKSVDCEIWTTRLFGYPAEEAIQRINQNPQIEGIVVTKEEAVWISNGLK